MRKKIESSLLKILAERMAKHATAMELRPKYALHKSVNLSDSEIKLINEVWKSLSPQIDYRYWEVYKGMFGFSPFLLPDDIYVRNILRVLNPIRKCYCLQNKNMYPILYKELRMPETLINCIDGTAYDANNSTVALSSIMKVLKQTTHNTKLILKPSADSCSGEGVKILDLSDEGKCEEDIKKAGNDFVIQEILLQSEKTKRFNPSSLNTFRINTLNLNDKITVENIMFRHGQGDAVVDNAGAGGICVGFDPDGSVVGKAIDAKLNVYEMTPFSEKYSNLKIPELQKISDLAIRAHRRYLPMMGHAAWDFALNEKDEPVMIEVNLGWPGVMTEQLSSCRPIFGKRMQEVIEYAKANQKKMAFTDFLGHWT